MEEFYKALFTPYWWISVVVVGILINLASAYLKTPIDNLFSQFSSRWAKRTTKKKEEFNALVKSLRDSETAQIFASLDMLKERMMSLISLVLGLMCIVLFTLLQSYKGQFPSNSVFYLDYTISIPSYFIFYQSVGFLRRSGKISAALKDARKPKPQKAIAA